MNHFNLFRKTLIEFNDDTVMLPITLLNPILIRLEFQLGGDLHYGDKNVTERVELLIKRLHYIASKQIDLEVFLMFSCISFIDSTFDFYDGYKLDIVRASSEILSDNEQANNDVYWLSAWPPSKVIGEQEFFKGITLAKEIWLDKSNHLRKVLFNLIQTPPYDEINYWDELRIIK